MAPFLPAIDLSEAKHRLKKQDKKNGIRDKPNLSLVKNEKEIDLAREYVFQAGLDEWYENLKSHTFESCFISIKPEEANAIIKHWELNYSNSSKTAENLLQEIDLETNTKDVQLPPLLSDLIDRIDQVIQRNFSKYAGVFVKLSTRSPKDSISLLRKTLQNYKKRVAELQKDKSKLTVGEKKVIYCEELVAANAVFSGREAITILLDSFRVYQDLLSAFKEEGKAAYPISLVVRKWDSRITPQCEFRAFVWDGKLTCIGQYWHFLNIPDLNQIKHQVAEDCRDFYQRTLKDSMPVPNAMLDLAWFGPGKVLLIEVNPLQEGMGDVSVSTGLFDFQNNIDRKVLTGASPFEIRVRTKDEGAGDEGYSQMGSFLEDVISKAGV